MKPTFALAAVSCALLLTPWKVLAQDDADAPAPATAPVTASSSAAAPQDPNSESNVEWFRRKSDEAFHAGDYPRAVQLHRAVVALDPSDVDAYSSGSWLLWSMGKTAEADAFLAQGLKANPTNPDMWNEAGGQYMLEKETAATEDAYSKALKFSPPGTDTDMLRRRYAHSLEKNGHLPEAVKVWEKLALDFPKDVVILNNLQRVQRESAHASALATGGAAVAAAGAAFFGVG